MTRYSPNQPAAVVAEGIPADRLAEATRYLQSIGAVSVRVGMSHIPQLTYEASTPEAEPREAITPEDLLSFEKSFRYPDLTAEVTLDELAANNGEHAPFNQVCLAHADNPEALCPEKLSRAIRSAICTYKVTKNSLTPQLGILPETFAFLMHVEGVMGPPEALPRPHLFTFDSAAAEGGLFVIPDTIRTFNRELGSGRSVRNDFVRAWGQNHVQNLLRESRPQPGTYLIDGVLATLEYYRDRLYTYTKGVEAERFARFIDTPDDTQDTLTIPTLYVVHRLVRAIQASTVTLKYVPPPNNYS